MTAERVFFGLGAACAFIAVALGADGALVQASGWLFVAGTVLFSGSLLALPCLDRYSGLTPATRAISP